MPVELGKRIYGSISLCSVDLETQKLYQLEDKDSEISGETFCNASFTVILTLCCPALKGDADQNTIITVNKRFSTRYMYADNLGRRIPPQTPLKPKKQPHLAPLNKPKIKPKPALKPTIHQSKPSQKGQKEERPNFAIKHGIAVNQFVPLLCGLFLWQSLCCITVKKFPEFINFVNECSLLNSRIAVSNIPYFKTHDVI